MSAELLARGATPLDPGGARKSLARGTTPLNPRYERTRERAQLLARGATPLDPRRQFSQATPVRRIRDEARDGLSAAAVSLAGSVAVTAALWLVLRWLG
jgi:hypothetical protein